LIDDEGSNMKGLESHFDDFPKPQRRQLKQQDLFKFLEKKRGWESWEKPK